MMEVSCKTLRKRAWDKLAAGRYGNVLGASLLYGFVAPAGSVFTAGPMEYGISDYLVREVRGEKPAADKVFEGFNKFGETLVSYLLYVIYLTLWSLLTIPGIIKSYSYSMTFFVMRDFGLKGNAAITKSRELMKGYKWKKFKLDLSFIGWHVLGILTGGIGELFLAPYINLAMAEFYEELLKCHGIDINAQPEQPVANEVA